MKNLRNTTSKAVKKENSTKKVLNRMEGITLVALVITVIVMLILAGVSISALMGNEGLFARTANAADAYKQASEKENADIESLLNELDKTLDELQGRATIVDLAKNGTLKVGDYIDYKAGKWTAEDLDKIKLSDGMPTLHSTVDDDITGNMEIPLEQGQFGGFELEYSKDENSTPFVDYKAPETSGWRIWSIDEASGKVTIIHAGHPETYCQTSGGNSSASINILRKRNCSMYENKYAVKGSAHFLTGHEAANWYMENCLTAEEKESGTTYKLEGYDEDIDGNEIVGENSFDYVNTFNEEGPISVLNNKSLYYFATAQSAERLYYLQPSGPGIASNSGFYSYGVRPLVILKTSVMLKTNTGNGSEESPWQIVEN